MYRIAEGNSRGFKDLERFIELLNDPPAKLQDLFNFESEIYIARAPGRLDVMGGIADYSGSLVLEMPIAEATLAAAQKSEDGRIVIRTRLPEGGEYVHFEIDFQDLAGRTYEDARMFFSRERSDHWAAYVAGIFPILKNECGFDLQNGARILISSDVPAGKGVSSSAALEVATMNAVCAAYGLAIEPRQMALLCQKVENLIVGAPCGVMDQITSNCGAENSLVSLLCQPAEIKESVSIPDGVEFWGIDSGVRHAVTGSDYSAVRTAAFMGYRLIADVAGLTVKRIENGGVVIDDPRWNGYLSNFSRAEYERDFSSQIPETILGADFIGRYDGITDIVTRVDPKRTYPVRAATEFPIYENARAAQFTQLLKSDEIEDHLAGLGQLMFESHAGYAACGLTEPGTERLVGLVRENRRRGLLGARITGGGSGGTVAILGQAGSAEVVREIARKYGEETGREPYVFRGSSPGCAEFGWLRLSAA
jgi:L-arabinokinase